MRQSLLLCLIASLVAGPVTTPAAFAGNVRTATPIKHIVIIFNENRSFDHYFGTYPYALNPPGEPQFHPMKGTPTVNGYGNPATPSALLTKNPNLNPTNNAILDNNIVSQGSNPFRFDRSQANTQDMNHGYTAEQLAFDRGLMDLFPLNTGTAGPPPGAPSVVLTTGQVMGYFDGNTVTALWNYAQHYAMNDNSFGTDFGPSTVGAINLISGQNNGVVRVRNGDGDIIPDGYGGRTNIGDPDPWGDVCSGSEQAQMGGRNIGDLLNAAGITWGWFAGGFNLSYANPENGSSGCTPGTGAGSRYSTSTLVSALGQQVDYSPHHTPFQYYASTSNPTHARPTSNLTIGFTDAANHNYDVMDFFAAVSAGNFPAVSFLKPIRLQDAHPGNSDPLDEQQFIVKVVKFLQSQPEWSSTALVILYDDSDGWYDHQMGPIVNTSETNADALTGGSRCGTDGKATALPGVFPATLHAQGRCGYGPRQPLLVISPWSKHNFVDHTLTDQTSVIRFIEDNWLGGTRIGQGSFDALANSIASMFDFHQVISKDPVVLDENTGEVVNAQP
jgi:phospholipase C